MTTVKSGKLTPGQSQALYPTLKDTAKEGRTLFTSLGAAVLATGFGACSGSGLHGNTAGDGALPDQASVGQPDRSYPDGVPPAYFSDAPATDLNRDTGGDGAMEPGQPDRFSGVIIDGGPPVWYEVSPPPDLNTETGRDGALEPGQPDRSYPDGVPAYFEARPPSDPIASIDASKDTRDAGQPVVDAGSGSEAK